MPRGGVSDCQCFDDQQLSAGDAVPGFFFLRPTETETLMAFVYLLSGIAIFSVTFAPPGAVHALYQPDPSAIQNISEGDLNTAIEVRGDDEFTAMAVNLNKMVGDIRNPMDKEREAERTKNELITNVA